MRTHPFMRALNTLAPDAKFTLSDSIEWNSLTFSGYRLLIRCELKNRGYYNRLKAVLADHEFALPRLIVVDVAMSSEPHCGPDEQIVIEALVLDE